MRNLLLTCIISLAASLANATEAPIRLNDVQGAAHTPLEIKNQKAVVLIFITTDCPIANAFAPEIKRICDEYSAKNVGFYLVHTDPDLKADEAAKHAKDFGYTCPVLLDPAHALVKAAHATVTPEAVVYAADGSVKYRGRINDQYVDIGKKRVQVTQHDLRAALDAMLSGKPVAIAKTQAVGCLIQNVEGEQK